MAAPEAAAVSKIAMMTAIASLSLGWNIAVLGFILFMGSNAYAIASYRAAKKAGEDRGAMDYGLDFMGGFFAGCIFFLVGLYATEDSIMAWVCGGTGAFMGFGGMTRFGEMLMDKMGGVIGSKND